jgi:hypothetical protein
METLWGWAGSPLDFQWPHGPNLARTLKPAASAGSNGVVMLDIVMLAIGVGAFALLIGYVALCERL